MENIINILDKANDMGIIIYILKLIFINLCTYYTYCKVTNTKIVFNIKLSIIIVMTCIISIFCGEIKYRLDYLTSIICIILGLGILYTIVDRNEFIYNIVNVIICLSINYIIFFITIIFTFIPNLFFKVQNDYINLIIMIILHIIILNLIFNIKRFKHGLNFLKERHKDEYFSILILNISINIIFSIIIIKNANKILTQSLAVELLLLSIIIFITVKKILTLYYKHELLVKDLEDTQVELEKKKEEITKLEQENLNFSKTSHSIAHKQKILEHKLNEMMMKNETSSEMDIKNELDKISKEYYKDVTTIELSKTGIGEIDDTLEYMKSECIKNNIVFELQVHENIYYMINHFITKEELQILLADHIKDAIIAIQHSDNINRSILVRLGLIDGCYSLYIYDSGIEFEIDTLLNLGDRPVTTHPNEGGTGMGFLNTFDTLRKHDASMTINELGKPCKDNYTKIIMIKFDNQNKFKIKSYRTKDIKECDTNNKLCFEE